MEIFGYFSSIVALIGYLYLLTKNTIKDEEY